MKKFLKIIITAGICILPVWDILSRASFNPDIIILVILFIYIIITYIIVSGLIQAIINKKVFWIVLGSILMLVVCWFSFFVYQIISSSEGCGVAGCGKEYVLPSDLPPDFIK